MHPFQAVGRCLCSSTEHQAKYALGACWTCASSFFIDSNWRGGCAARRSPAQLAHPGRWQRALTTGEERRLGDRIIRELDRDPDYIDDPVLVEYVQGLWQALLAAARARGELSPELDERFAWEVLLGRDRTVNAFALPGGYLGVHLGLIGVVATRDELASVLAHELSHVTQRHISRLIAQQSRQTPLLVGAMVLAALAASKNPGAAQAMVVGGQAVAMQNQLNFSRDMEREADRIGYGLMEPSGFAPQGFVGMFDKLQQANRLNDNGSWPYLRSHPLTTQRMADMQSRLARRRGAACGTQPGARHGGRAGPRAVPPGGCCGCGLPSPRLLCQPARRPPCRLVHRCAAAASCARRQWRRRCSLRQAETTMPPVCAS
jgi:predicted Zn-dependent protease